MNGEPRDQHAAQLSKYVETSTEIYRLVGEAFAGATQRALSNAKAAYEILSTPYASRTFDGAYAEACDRGVKLVELARTELETRSTNAAKLAKDLSARGDLLRETQAQLVSEALRNGMSSLKPVIEAQVDEAKSFTKLMDAASGSSVGAVI